MTPHPWMVRAAGAISAASLVLISLGSSDARAGDKRRSHGAQPIQFKSEERDSPGDAAEWWHGQRAFPASELPDTVYLTGYAEWRAVTQPIANGASRDLLAPAPPSWTLIGPAGLDYAGSATPNMGPAAGRLTAFVIDPTNANTMYAGFALGGVWKSTNGGASWSVLTDDQPSLAVGAMVLDANNPSILYVGTGEGNYSGDSFFGQGILKSVDGGASFTLVGADTFRGLSIARMFSDPAGALYVGAVQGVGGSGASCITGPLDVSRRGLYKSTDGAAHFTQLVSGAAVTDFEVDTTSTPRKGFLTEYRVGAFRFDESTIPASLTAVTGLPSSTSSPPIFRIELARSKSNPQVLYAGVGRDTSTSAAQEDGMAEVYRSVNGGTTWTQIANAPDYCADQCMYDNIVEIDPTNADTVYFGGSTCSVYKLTNGTTGAPTWSVVSLPAGTSCTGSNWIQGFVHSDAHAIAFHPTNANTLFVGSDGGLAKSTNGGASWTHLNTGISTLQFYDICVDPHDDTFIVGGLQDNGFVQRPQTGNTLFWRNYQTGDGTTCAINLADPTPANRYLLSSTQFASIQRRTSLNGAPQQVFAAGPGCTGSACGDRVAFVPPITNDPSAPLNVYVGTYRLWKSATGGATVGSFQPISPDLTSGQQITCSSGRIRDDVVTAIAVAPSSSQRIYTGSYSGRVFTTANGGTSWTNVTKLPLPGRFVSGIAVDATNPAIVYVSFSGFSSITPSTPGHIFRSTDAGVSWSRFDAGLDPLDLPINSIRTHPGSSEIVYAGHDLGVVATGNGGSSWQPVGTGLPNVLVFALRYYDKSSTLYASTHGRSAWSLQFVPSLTAAPAMLTFTARQGQNPPSQPLTVSNGDTLGSTLQFTAAPSGGAWLTVNPGSGKAIGATGQSVSVGVNTGGLAVGTYDATVALTAASGTPSSLGIPVHLTISPNDVDAGTTNDASSTPDASSGGDSGATVEASAETGTNGDASSSRDAAVDAPITIDAPSDIGAMDTGMAADSATDVAVGDAASDSGASAGAGGAGTGGAAGSIGTAGTGGMIGTGGTAGGRGGFAGMADAGRGAGAGGAVAGSSPGGASDDGGCGCRVARSSSARPYLPILLGLAGFVARRRRSRRA